MVKHRNHEHRELLRSFNLFSMVTLQLTVFLMGDIPIQ